MQVFEKIRELRESRNWTQEDVANKVALSVNGYAKIERGETRLTLDRLEQFAEIFDIDITKLIQTEGGFFYQVNRSENNNQGNFYHTPNLTLENDLKECKSTIEKLQLSLDYKNELLEQQARELETLQLLVASLQSKK